jgi:hypothetical protein
MRMFSWAFEASSNSLRNWLSEPNTYIDIIAMIITIVSLKVVAGNRQGPSFLSWLSS